MYRISQTGLLHPVEILLENLPVLQPLDFFRSDACAAKNYESGNHPRTRKSCIESRKQVYFIRSKFFWRICQSFSPLTFSDLMPVPLKITSPGTIRGLVNHVSNLANRFTSSGRNSSGESASPSAP